MSAPDTNTEKQEREHKPSLLGIRGAMIWGALCIVGLIFYVVMNGDDPTADDVTNTDQAGDTEQTDPSTPAVDEVEPGTNQSN